MELTVLIKAPELAAAINNLAAAIAKLNAAPQPAAVPQNPVTPTQPTMPTQVPAPQPTAVPQNPAPAANASAFPATGVPVASPPQYTVDQIMAAGATLVDAGKTQELMNLLQSFGVQAVTNLRPEQYGAFVTEMRKLGAAI